VCLLYQEESDFMIKATPIINITNLSKKYGEFFANQSINITIPKGHCHAFIGQNGSGKSTLIGMLSGRIKPTEGNIFIEQNELHYGDPYSSREAGIATIFQELTIIPNMTALDNVFLGFKEGKSILVNRKKRLERFYELSKLLNTHISPNSYAIDLSVADQQILEIMRCLNLDSKILILDEPTSSLAQNEREALLEALMELKKRGITILYVSHHLDEIMKICDSFTVLKNGVVTEHRDIEGWTKQKIVHAMLGEEIDSDFKEILMQEYPHQIPSEEIVLEVENLESFHFLKNISFTLKRGEILGLGGLVGSGRSAIAHTLYGLGEGCRGTLKLQGESLKIPSTPRQAMGYGIVLAPEDRKKTGLHLGFEVHENIHLIDLKRIGSYGFLSTKKSKNLAQQYIREFKLTRPINSIVKNLSGGNQQKVLLSKVTSVNPKVLIVDEPTRGIDVGVKLDVLRKLKELAMQGMSIIIISSELEEVVAVSNRVLVISKGEIVNELTGKDISVKKIVESTFLEGSHQT